MNQTISPTPVVGRSTTPTIRPLRLRTLIAVELRKMTDTRSGRWLLGTIVALSALVLAWRVGHSKIAPWYHDYGLAVTMVVAYLAPVIALLAMTSEWTQRTALTTFTIAPRRLPVIAAKFVAAIVLSLAAYAAVVALSLLATVIGGLLHGPADYTWLVSDIRGGAIIVLLQVVMAAAFGALAAQTAPAIVAFFVAPAAWGAISNEVFRGTAPWFDVFAAYDRLSSTDPFDHLGQTLTSVAVWVGLPAAVGIIRSLRREVK